MQNTKERSTTTWMTRLFCEKVDILKALGFSEVEAKMHVKRIMSEAIDIIEETK